MSDPKGVEITDRKKEDGWYKFEGVVDGKRVSVDVHAKDVESRSRKDAESLAKRSLYGTARLPPDADRGK